MKTIELTDSEFEIVYWAIHDSMRVWKDNIRDHKDGLLPSMSLEGADIIYSKLSQVKTKFKVLQSFK